jgi:hypothetical protein
MLREDQPNIIRRGRGEDLAKTLCASDALRGEAVYVFAVLLGRLLAVAD